MLVSSSMLYSWDLGGISSDIKSDCVSVSLIVEGINPVVRKFSISKQKFMDGFDYEYYYTYVYKDDQLNGKECLLIV